jgi:hypothetical protein
MREGFNEVIRDEDREYMILGPTEIWPFVDKNRNVLIMDVIGWGGRYRI